MRRTTLIIICFCLGTLFLGSCKKYLAVQPVGQYTNPQVFTNENAIDQALNGLYNNMGGDSLYGASLSTTTIELLAQQWYTGNAIYGEISNYTYTSTDVEPYFEGIWQTAYSTILGANVIIQGIDGAVSGGVLNAAHGNEIKGEAIAIRAMLHLDLLRIFGPVMSTNASSPAIPYYRIPDAQVQPIISGIQALDSILADLAEAESLLSADPIITSGPNVAAYGSRPDFYAGDRSQRLNYYAVKALMARAYLWGGFTAAAHDSALATLNEAASSFPWLPVADIIGSPADPDRIFSTEVLFGVYNIQMYNNYNANFLPSLSSLVVLGQQQSSLSTTFENNENDYRYETTWADGPNGIWNFFKYAQNTDETVNWEYIQPLIRKSELYYILAETDPNQPEAFSYLDSVRYNRGLPNLDPATAVLSAEIQKEHQKEFFGEGQLFFYYKRTNNPALPIYNWPYSITPVYQVPLPLSETTLR